MTRPIDLNQPGTAAIDPEAPLLCENAWGTYRGRIAADILCAMNAEAAADRERHGLAALPLPAWVAWNLGLWLDDGVFAAEADGGGADARLLRTLEAVGAIRGGTGRR